LLVAYRLFTVCYLGGQVALQSVEIILQSKVRSVFYIAPFGSSTAAYLPNIAVLQIV
jgi:hypothetical protein